MRLRPSPLLIAILAASAFFPASITSAERQLETASSSAAAAPAITGTTDAAEHSLIRLELVGVPVDAKVVWEAIRVGKHGIEDADGEALGTRFLFTGPPATWRVSATYFAADAFGKVTMPVVIRSNNPEPDPTPPGPGPKPDPDPEPEPDDTAPFPADGLHVLIVYESSQMNGLTADQREIIQGATTRAALNAAAPDRYRIYDKDADLTHVPQVWKDAMAVPRQSLPWLVISNGKAGYSGPLDMTAAEFRDLLTEFK